MKEKRSPVSVRQIAARLGLSKTTVGDALNHSPRVKAATRELVERTAREMGYVPDARISTVMAQVRQADAKDLLPLAWLSTTQAEESWSRYAYLAPYYAGAKERARQLGYRLEEFWTNEPGMSARRLSGILDAQGIGAVIVTYPARHLNIDWQRVAAVSLGGAMLSPRLDTVMTDHYFNFTLALKMAKRAGYRRIGIFLAREMDRFSSHLLQATAHFFYHSDQAATQLPPHFYEQESPDYYSTLRRELSEWIGQHRPDVVLSHSIELVNHLEHVGYRVPGDIACIHLGTDDDASDWAGINAQKRVIGAKAVEAVIARLHRGDFGPPQVDTKTLVRGSWHGGWTMPVRK